MYQKILVPLDGSNTAEVVIPYMEAIAAKIGAVVLLAVVSEPTRVDMGHLYRTYLEGVTEQVRRQLKDWGDKETRVQNEVLLGSPADEILRYAVEKNVDLIAMTSRGASNKGPWLLGSIAAKVVRATSKPVLLIRTLPSDTAIQQRKLIKRILLPLDGSREGEAAIPHAQALGKLFNAELVSFQFVGSIEAQVVRKDNRLSGTSLTKADQEKMVSARAYVDSVAAAWRKEGLSASSEITSGLGSAAEQIIDYTAANAIDLIAMATHGRSGINRWVFGSVTDKVLHAGDTPVLVVRSVKA